MRCWFSGRSKGRNFAGYSGIVFLFLFLSGFLWDWLLFLLYTYHAVIQVHVGCNHLLCYYLLYQCYRLCIVFTVGFINLISQVPRRGLSMPFTISNKPRDGFMHLWHMMRADTTQRKNKGDARNTQVAARIFPHTPEQEDETLRITEHERFAAVRMLTGHCICKRTRTRDANGR